jgi:hypothetical protein
MARDRLGRGEVCDDAPLEEIAVAAHDPELDYIKKLTCSPS